MKEYLSIELPRDLGLELLDHCGDYLIFWLLEICPKVHVQSGHFEWISISSLSSAVMMWSMVQM
jgi:hypothetical protein